MSAAFDPHRPRVPPAPASAERCPDAQPWLRWLFRPAALLLGRAGLTTRFAVLWTISIIAVVGSVHSLSLGMDRVVEPSRRQLAGLPLVAPITRTLRAVHLHRGLTAAALAGQRDLSGRLDAQSREVSEALDALAGRLPTALVAEQGFAAIAAQWREIEATKTVASPAQSLGAHNLLVEQLQHLLVRASDAFLLTQDPDLPSFYLLDTAIHKLPHAIEHIARLRAFCTVALARGSLDSAQRFELRVQLAELEGAMGDVARGLSRAAHHLPALAPRLVASMERLGTAARGLTDVVAADLLSGRLTTAPDAFLGLASQAVDLAYAELSERLLPAAAVLIEARIAEARETWWLSAGLAIVSFVLLVYVSGGIFYSTLCSLRALARSARELAAGQLDARVHTDSRDELRGIGEAFNAMAESVSGMLESRREDAERFRATIETAMDAVVQIDASGTIIGWNGQAERTFGWTRDEVLGRPLDDTIVPRQFRDAHRQALERYVATGRGKLPSSRVELTAQHRDGRTFPVELSVAAIQTGARREFSAFIRDITREKEAEQRIWRHANYDVLTGLPNRFMLHDRLAHVLAKAPRSGRKTALLFIDLDKFKEVNDTLGHTMGDQLLTQAARRIAACVRSTDTVARLGGDEFTVILPDFPDTATVDRVCEAILARLIEPFQLGDELAYVSASVGITIYPDDATTMEELLKNADQAMYAAKSAGRGRSSYFTSAMQVAAQERLRLTNELRVALANGQIRVHYQPIVDLATGRILKAEALARWEHPTRGTISPATFIPVAEETGLILALGHQVCREAARHLKRWVTEYDPALGMTVNVSPVQLGKLAGDAYREWLNEIEYMMLPRYSLEIEITEGILVDGDAGVAAKLREFREAGVRVSIDDFGTGYSSLAYLHRFEVDVLKIDRSFIGRIAEDPHSRALTEAIIAMAHRLGKEVVAEGVETEAQRRILIEAGCDAGQGWLFGRPMDAEAFEALLAAAHRTDDAAVNFSI